MAGLRYVSLAFQSLSPAGPSLPASLSPWNPPLPALCAARKRARAALAMRRGRNALHPGAAQVLEQTVHSKCPHLSVCTRLALPARLPYALPASLKPHLLVVVQTGGSVRQIDLTRVDDDAGPGPGSQADVVVMGMARAAAQRAPGRPARGGGALGLGAGRPALLPLAQLQQHGNSSLAAAAARPPIPPPLSWAEPPRGEAPPSPEQGYKCVICLERQGIQKMATIPCGCVAEGVPTYFKLLFCYSPKI